MPGWSLKLHSVWFVVISLSAPFPNDALRFLDGNSDFFRPEQCLPVRDTRYCSERRQVGSPRHVRLPGLSDCNAGLAKGRSVDQPAFDLCVKDSILRTQIFISQ
jgi:hypothetical protein